MAFIPPFIQQFPRSIPPQFQVNNSQTQIYFEPPPFIQTTIKYQDVNNDKKLQDIVTNKFLNKTIKWLHDDKDFNKSKKYLSKIEGKEGYEIIYKLLKLFVKKGDTNWYDLSDQSTLVKDFIRYKLSHY